MAERVNCIILEMARSMLHAQNLYKSFWAEVMVYAVYIQNCCPTRVLDSITPEAAWPEKRPCIVHMCVFGSFPTQWCRMNKRVSLMQRT